METKIFYSWQSDLPRETNSKAIRVAINHAISRVEESLEESHLKLDEAERPTIKLDEATTDMPGSMSISDSIFQKISECDIFIADISIINKDASNHRKTPNPNVLIELGYAVGLLGWGRIILLFNKEYGNITDLPFDIQGNRVSAYRKKDKDDKGGAGSLKKVVEEAISSIISQKPSKRVDIQLTNPSLVKRSRDVDMLRWLFKSIDLSALDELMETLPEKISRAAIFSCESVYYIFKDSRFYIQNESTSNIVKDFVIAWHDLVDQGRLSFFPSDTSSEWYFLGLNGQMHRIPRLQNAYNNIIAQKDKLKHSYTALIAHIHQEYIELDLTTTSRFARNEYIKMLNDTSWKD